MVGTHEDYEKHKEKRLAYAKEYYKKNKPKINRWKKQYRKKNPEKVKEYRRKRYLQETGDWYREPVDDSQDKAEGLVKKMLINDGFNEVWKPTKNFYFDWLAKKGNKKYAIEVTTSMQKSLKEFHTKFLKFFGLSLLVFFVRPDLSKAYKIESSDSQSYFHYKQGKGSGILEEVL